MSALYFRLRIWFARRRVVFLTQEAEFHRSLAVSLADQADRLERQITLAALSLFFGSRS